MKDRACRVFRYIKYSICRHLIWGGNDRPARMYSMGRPLDNPISQEELLYFRCQKDWIFDGKDYLKPAKIPFPDQSVNRKKYSKPIDILLPDDNDEKSADYIYWGVAKIATKQIPSDFAPEDSSKKDQVKYKFTVEHDPVEKNYSHSEIRVYKNNTRATKISSQQVKKSYRTDVSFRSRVIIKPIV